MNYKDLYEMNMEYENIHSHTMYSNVMTPDSIITHEDKAIRAKELGQKTLSTVEHGYCGNLFEAFNTSTKYDLKLIFGIEYYFVKNRFEQDRTNAHILVIAKNENGKQHMTRIMSEANMTGRYGKPRIDEELLFSLPKNDVIVTTACIASPFNKYDEDYSLELLLKCKDYFGNNFYLELQPHTHILQRVYNEKLVNFHEKFNIPFILGIDSHYIKKDDYVYRDIFLKSKKIDYPHDDGFIIDYPDVPMIINRFEEQSVVKPQYIKQAFDNSLIVREFDGVELDTEVKMPTLYPNLTHDEKCNKVKQIINKQWLEDRKHIPKTEWKKYLEAIKFETDIIFETHMEDYFLINEKIIKKGIENGGILTKSGRGSAVSMYVNKLFGFTEVDRLDAPIQLYPTRFMSKSRILETKSLPDIDFNTADAEPFLRATKQILGDDHCYQMIAFGTMAERDAFKSYCRGLDIPLDKVETVIENLDKYSQNDEWKDIIENSKKFIGTVVSYSPHPCSSLIYDKSIKDNVGLIQAKDGSMLALIDSGNSDKYKFLKNDILVVTVYKIIGDVFKEINKPIIDVRQLIKETENDERIWKLFEDGIVATLNQAGTDSGKPQIMEYKPKNIRELSMWVAAIRPSFASLRNNFIKRQSFTYNIPEFDKILETSDNYVLFQENIMATLQYAGFPEDETYSLLKAIAKKKSGIIEPIYEKFIQGFTDKTGSKEQAENVWQIIEDAVGYGFNSSHAYSVALDCLYGAYLKANYPLEYYNTVLNIYADKPEKQAEIIEEFPYFNIELKPISFGKSKKGYVYNKKENAIYKGVGTIKFINDTVADNLYNVAQQKTWSDIVELFLYIIDEKIADNRAMNILIKLGYFNDYGSRDILLELYNSITEYQKKKFNPIIAKDTGVEKFAMKYSKTHKEATKQKRIENIYKYYQSLLKLQDLIPKTKYSEQLQDELEYLGYPILINKNEDSDVFVVVDINTKYTPVYTLYNISQGISKKYKLIKKKAFDENGNLYIPIGSVIKLIKQSQKPQNKLVDGKWIKNTDIMIDYIEKVKLL